MAATTTTTMEKEANKGCRTPVSQRLISCNDDKITTVGNELGSLSGCDGVVYITTLHVDTIVSKL